MKSVMPEVQTLDQHYETLKDVHMRDLFAQDGERFGRFSLSTAGILLDYSKNRVTVETMTKLFQLAESLDLTQKIQDLFAGAEVNTTECRAALHMALRNTSGDAQWVNGIDVTAQVQQTLKQMAGFANRIRGDHSITDIVNIGIGGSDLGPALVTEALSPYHDSHLRFHFVANVDGSHISEVLEKLNPASTLFIVASKSFRTQESIYNAVTAKLWLIEQLGEQAVPDHFVAVTANNDAAQEFGIKGEHIFPIWDWVGGRFSVWSAVGLPVLLAIGMESFQEFLEGAHAMDQHFQSAPLEKNIPVIMGLLSVWYINFFGTRSRAVIPYDYYLSRLPAYLQQAEMESNGKRVKHDGTLVDYQTSPVIFGTTGSNGQHAFHQMLHQGTHMVPVDFIIALQSHNPIREHHAHLVANCFSQSQALMQGNDQESYKDIPGNKPSNTIVLEKLTPHSLGAMLAMYEHKIFVQGVIWGINSFDQWGVEFGKQLASSIFTVFEQRSVHQNLDSSTAGLISYFLECSH